MSHLDLQSWDGPWKLNFHKENEHLNLDMTNNLGLANYHAPFTHTHTHTHIYIYMYMYCGLYACHMHAVCMLRQLTVAVASAETVPEAP